MKLQVKELAEDIKEGRPRDFEIVVEEAELNELLLSDPEAKRALDQLQIREAYVRVEPGAVQVTAFHEVGGLDVASTVAVHPRVSSDGRVAVSVDSARVGRLRMPDAVTQRFANRMASEVEKRANDRRLRMTSVRVELGRVVIEGSTR